MFFKTYIKLISQYLTISAWFLKLYAHSGKTQCPHLPGQVGRITEFNLCKESIADLLQGLSNMDANSRDLQ